MNRMMAHNFATSLFALAIGFLLVTACPGADIPRCRIAPVSFDGWSAQELSNSHLRLTFVPQLGGRLMQLTFDGHPFLFVNPKYKGRYIPPAAAKELKPEPVVRVNPATPVELDRAFSASPAARRIAVHLVDAADGTDYGNLGEAQITSAGAGS
jgi:hypothetical protein